MDASMTAGALSCPTCSGTVSAGERFCEACGAKLAPSPPVEEAQLCPSCGGAVADDGYCTRCGARATSPRDHFTEQPAPWVAGVCDRGVRHSRNEDAVALDAWAEPGSRAVLVVCDGASSSTESDVASLAAARAARTLLAISSPQGLRTMAARVAATAKALEAAADAANDAVIAHTPPGWANPAACTFVAAVVDESLLVVGWVGDSRAYWLPDVGEARLLTVDDSYAAEQIAEGVARAEAERGPQAHAITRWLGVDTPDHTPSTVSIDLGEPGWVLVCSDGLWNYCSEPRDLAALVREKSGATGSTPLELADALVGWANDQGGADNITVGVARIDRPGSSTTALATAAADAQAVAHREEDGADGNVLS
jgi:serine/threonine protein phosphatase PrpC